MLTGESEADTDSPVSTASLCVQWEFLVSPICLLMVNHVSVGESSISCRFCGLSLWPP